MKELVRKDILYPELSYKIEGKRFKVGNNSAICPKWPEI
jgi:hypothetical protein